MCGLVTYVYIYIYIYVCVCLCGVILIRVYMCVSQLVISWFRLWVASPLPLNHQLRQCWPVAPLLVSVSVFENNGLRYKLKLLLALRDSCYRFWRYFTKGFISHKFHYWWVTYGPSIYTCKSKEFCVWFPEQNCYPTNMLTPSMMNNGISMCTAFCFPARYIISWLGLGLCTWNMH